MSSGFNRYKTNPNVSDTTGFFNTHIPYNLGIAYPANDSIARFFNYSNLPSFEKHQKVSENQLVTSIFVNHNLKSDLKGPHPNERPSNDWMTFIIMLSLFLLAWIQNNYSKRLRQIFKSVFQPYFVNQLEREGNLLNERIRFALTIIFVSGAALSVFLLIESMFPGTISLKQRFPVFLSIVTALVGFILLKTFLITFTGSLFKNKEMAHSHQINNLIFNQVAGLGLFTGSTLSFLTGLILFTWIGSVIAVLLFVWRTYRVLIVGINSGHLSISNLFFYLCTLEILPVLIIIKTLSNLLNS